MQVVIATRHGEISDRMETQIREELSRLSRFESRVSRVEVTLNREKNRWEVEGLAHVDRADPVHASADGDDLQTLVDQMLDRMTRQLKRLRERHRDHQGPTKGLETFDEGGP